MAEPPAAGLGLGRPVTTLRLGTRRGRAQGDYWVAVGVGVVVVFGYLLVLTAATVHGTYNERYALLLAPALFIGTSFVLGRMLDKVEPDPWIRRAVMLGLAAKLLSAFARYYVNEFVLGHADASAYYDAGLALSRQFRSFVFSGPVVQSYLPNLTGTRFMRLVSGIVYIGIGPSQLAGYVMFSFLSYWGLYLFYRAFSIAVPDGLRRRYTVLVFFLPSVVFWPSSIGKEAWMTTMLGLGSYGLARVLTQRRGAYVAFLVAVAAMMVVRPHVAAIFGAGTAAAFILRRTKGSGGTARKVISLLVLALAAGLVLNQLQSFFDLQDGLNPEQVLNETTRRSSQGGSQFEAVNPTSPAQLPWALITVLFRPFLYEAGGVAGLVTALEGTLLIGLFLWNLPRLARLPAMILARPYLGYALVYLLIFGFAFSSISNFGILARQRTQLFPIAVVLLAVPHEPQIIPRSARRRSGPLGALPSPPPAGADAEPEPSGRRAPVRNPGSGARSDARVASTARSGVVQARYIGRSPAARRRAQADGPGAAAGADTDTDSVSR